MRPLPRGRSCPWRSQPRKRQQLAETRSVDDQVQWLDDEQVLYALRSGRGPPLTMADRAASGIERIPIVR